MRANVLSLCIILPWNKSREKLCITTNQRFLENCCLRIEDIASDMESYTMMCNSKEILYEIDKSEPKIEIYNNHMRNNIKISDISVNNP